MQTENLMDLAARIEVLPTYDAALTRQAFDLVSRDLPEADRAMIEAGSLGSIAAVLVLIDHALPGWAVSMTGIANDVNGHWTCTLRRSGAQDDDAFIGIGKGPKLSNALLGALLKALAQGQQM
jgi:hypothetical protein